MARPFARPPGPSLNLPSAPRTEEALFVESRLNGGMISQIDKADVPSGALTFAQNARIRYDKTSRRPGATLYTPVKPNSSKIMRLYQHKIGPDTRYLLRFTGSGGHYSNGAAWIALTGTLLGGEHNPINVALIRSTLVLANGVDRIKKVDLSTGTIADLGDNAPRTRYVTGFFNRVVGASAGFTSEGMITVYWSGDDNLDEFDAAEDESAGQSPIIDSPDDTTDFITGLLTYGNTLVLPRERSLWLATKKPIASDPFNFFNAEAGIGFNVPASIQLTADGIVGFDTLSKNIWVYQPGSSIQPIGDKVKDELMSTFSEPDKVFSVGSKNFREYMIGLIQADGTVRVWVFNFATGGWAFDVRPNASALAYITELSDYTSFDELTGTFNALAGTFDALSKNPVESGKLYIGRSDGDIHVEDETADDDNAVAYTFDIRSKEFEFPDENDLTISRIRVDYIASSAGSLVLLYSKNGGQTWTTAKTKAMTVGGSQIFKYHRAIRARRLMWRITATDGLFDILGYKIYVTKSGDAKK